MTAPEDDDIRPGVPGYGRPAPAAPEPPPPPDDGPRPGDPGTGRPVMLAASVADLSDADLRRLGAARDAEARAESERLEELLATEPALDFLPAFLAHPVAAMLLLGAGSLVGLFVFSQVASTLAALQGLRPDWLQYAAWAGLGLPVAALAYAAARLTVAYVRLRRNRQVRLPDLEALAGRTHLRWLVHEKREAARDRLTAYLREFPLADARGRRTLVALGLTEETLLRLEGVRDGLLDPNRYTHADEWFGRFRSDFQGPLDAAADARVTHYARRVALMTAVSPNTLIDTLVAGYGGLALLADLCRVYHLRVGRLGSAVLLGRIFFNTYLAGQLNEFEGVAADQIQGLLGEWAASKLLARLGSKATTGALNYLLLRRLGVYAVRLLRPVSAG